MSTDTTPRPNHHGHHHGFSGVTGILAALSMAWGRDGDARIAAERTSLAPGDRLLDVGCGPGAAARFAARAGAVVTGIDPAKVMLDVARRLTKAGAVDYLDGRAESLPCPDASADVVWALATVHHWPQLEAGLTEVRRVLAPGGRFLAMEARTRPGARGHASHGWTDEQAAAFADVCSEAGFVDVSLTTHEGGRRPFVSVLARRPRARLTA